MSWSLNHSMDFLIFSSEKKENILSFLRFQRTNAVTAEASTKTEGIKTVSADESPVLQQFQKEKSAVIVANTCTHTNTIIDRERSPLSFLLSNLFMLIRFNGFLFANIIKHLNFCTSTTQKIFHSHRNVFNIFHIPGS